MRNILTLNRPRCFTRLSCRPYWNLTQNLVQEGHKDLALNVLHKYDEEMPDIYPFIDVARSKYYLVANAYTLDDIGFANRYANSIDNYIVDQLDYNYTLLQKDASSADASTVQLGLSLLNAVSQASKKIIRRLCLASLKSN